MTTLAMTAPLWLMASGQPQNTIATPIGLAHPTTIAQSSFSPEIHNPKSGWLYSKSIPPESRHQLLPLYHQEDDLPGALQIGEWQASREAAKRAGAEVARVANLSRLQEPLKRSAAAAWQHDARSRGANAALAAPETGDNVPQG